MVYFGKELLSHVKSLVLDAGCGAGRHLLHLQKSGIRIVGVDKSTNAIKICKEKGADHVVIRAMPHMPFRD